MSERILRLDKAGTPVEWLDWQMAATLYARGLVTWTLGDVIYRLHGAPVALPAPVPACRCIRSSPAMALPITTSARHRL